MIRQENLRRAACRDRQPDEEFYRQDGEQKESTLRRYRTLMRDYCWQCPIIRECLSESLRRMEEHGLWGGWSEWDRERYWKARGIVSPREMRRRQAAERRKALAIEREREKREVQLARSG